VIPIHIGLKQRADIYPLLFYFALENAIRKVQEVLKLSEQINEERIKFCVRLLIFSSEIFVLPSAIQGHKL
jgi:hypothetical protein